MMSLVERFRARAPGARMEEQMQNREMRTDLKNRGNWGVSPQLPGSETPVALFFRHTFTPGKLSGTLVVCALLVMLFTRPSVVMAQAQGTNRVTEDPVWMVIQAYQQASNELRSKLTLEAKDQQTRLKFYGNWRDRLLAVAHENQGSQHRLSALIHALALRNGMDDYEASEA